MCACAKGAGGRGNCAPPLAAPAARRGQAGWKYKKGNDVLNKELQ